MTTVRWLSLSARPDDIEEKSSKAIQWSYDAKSDEKYAIVDDEQLVQNRLEALVFARIQTEYRAPTLIGRATYKHEQPSNPIHVHLELLDRVLMALAYFQLL